MSFAKQTFVVDFVAVAEQSLFRSTEQNPNHVLRALLPPKTCSGLELCADVIVSVGGGGAPPVQKNRRRRGVGGQKQFFLRFTKKFRSILKIFLGTFLVIKALRFADDQC